MAAMPLCILQLYDVDFYLVPTQIIGWFSAALLGHLRVRTILNMRLVCRTLYGLRPI